MAKIINYNNQKFNFPDNTTDEEINQFLEENHVSKPESPYQFNIEDFVPRKGEISDFAKGFAQELLDTGKGLMRNPVLFPLATSDIPELIEKYAPNPIVAPDTTKANLGRLGGMIGLGALGGAGSTAPRFLARTIQNLPFNATIGASQSPDHPVYGGLEGGAIGAVAPPAINFAIKEALRLKNARFNPLKYAQDIFGNTIKSKLPDEELMSALEATKGTETPLGNVISNPLLKGTYENVIGNTPFSGASTSMGNVENALIDRSKGIMEELRGPQGSNISNSKQVAENLNKYYQEEKFNKQSNYEFANKLANDSGLKLELPYFAKEAKSYKDTIDNNLILKNHPHERALLIKLSNYEKPVKEVKDPTKQSLELTPDVKQTIKLLENSKSEKHRNLAETIKNEYKEKTIPKYPTLQEAGLLKGQLRALAAKQEASVTPSSQNRSDAAVFNHLADALSTDLTGELEKHGNQTLIDSWKFAEDQYAKKFAPFFDPDVWRFIGPEKDADLLVQSAIKNGPNDRENLLQSFLQVLKPEDRRFLAHDYLNKRATASLTPKEIDFQKINPQGVATAFKKLGPRQREALFPRNEGNTFENLSNLTELTKRNQEALQSMLNPKTGARALLALIIQALASVTHVASSGASIAAARAANKFLTSEKVREAIVKNIINKRNAPAKNFYGIAQPASRVLSEALAGALSEKGQK